MSIREYPERKMVWVKKGEEAMLEAQAHPAKGNVYGATSDNLGLFKAFL